MFTGCWYNRLSSPGGGREGCKGSPVYWSWVHQVLGLPGLTKRQSFLSSSTLLVLCLSSVLLIHSLNQGVHNINVSSSLYFLRIAYPSPCLVCYVRHGSERTLLFLQSNSPSPLVSYLPSCASPLLRVAVRINRTYHLSGETILGQFIAVRVCFCPKWSSVT